MNTADINLLFWHAVSKVRLGSFVEASAIFHFLEDYHDDAALGRVYCLVRNGDFVGAASLLKTMRVPEGRGRSIYNRLILRCEKETQTCS